MSAPPPPPPTVYAVPGQRIRWAVITLRQAGIDAQVQRTPTGYVIQVQEDDAGDAYAAMQPIMAPPKAQQSGWRWATSVRKFSQFCMIGCLWFMSISFLVTSAPTLIGIGIGLLLPALATLALYFMRDKNNVIPQMWAAHPRTIFRAEIVWSNVYFWGAVVCLGIGMFTLGLF